MRLFKAACGLLLLALVIAVPSASASSLIWSELPPVPDPVGLGGPIVGTHNAALLVAGGANFPQGPPWEVDGQPPGPKVWHETIYLLRNPDSDWETAGSLPQPLAYAAVVSHATGIYVLGGETYGEPGDGAPKGNYPVRDVLAIRWDAVDGVQVEENALPLLPKASYYHAATLIGDTIYVTASHAEDEQSQKLDSKSFWSLNLSATADARAWKELEPWPGAARYQMALAVQASGADPQYASPECLYLFGGSTWSKGPGGDLDLCGFEYFHDNYKYNPKSGVWTEIAPLPRLDDSRTFDLTGYTFDEALGAWRRAQAGEPDPRRDIHAIYGDAPRPLSAAAAIDVGQSHVLLFSGSTGRYITLDVRDRPIFPSEVLSYHTITDTWVVAGHMPQPVVTTSAVRWSNRIVIPSGEVQPGVRTDRVQTVSALQRSEPFGVANMSVLIAYLAALVGMGIWFSKRKQGTADYFVAGGRIPWWAAGISIYATQLSAITFISLPAVAYANNWLVFPAQFTILLMAPVVVFLYLPFFRRLHVTTAYEYLERRFSLAVRLFGSLSFIVFQLGRMAIVVYLPAIALSEVTGLDINLAIVIMGVLATIYTVLGGMEAVIWTDVMQVFVLVGGMLVAIVLIALDLGGVAAVIETAYENGKFTTFNWSLSTGQMATWLIFLGSFVLNFGPYTTDQAVIQRYLTTKDERSAGRSIWLNGLLTIPFSLLFFILGAGLYAFFKANPDTLWTGMQNDRIFPLFVAQEMPAGLAGLVIAGVFAASMSSLDSSMHSIATSLTTDFYGRFRTAISDAHRLRVARGLTILVGLLGTCITLALASFDIQSLFFLFQKLLGLTSSGLVGIFMLGMFTRRANSAGVLTGAVAGIAALYYVSTYTSVNFYLYAVIGIGTVLAVGYGVSLVTPAQKQNLDGLTRRTLRKA